MSMASNYTCRACARALSRSSPLTTRTKPLPPKRSLRVPTPPLRSLVTGASSPKTLNIKSNGAQGRDDLVVKTDKTGTRIRVDDPRAPPRIGGGIAQAIRKRAPLLTETYVAYGATERLFKECARPGAYEVPQALEKGAEIPTDESGAHIGVGKGWWYETLGLTPTFMNWAQITFIHMYMLQVRFRMFPETHADLWIQHITNHAFYGAEDNLVIWHKLNANSLRQKYLKDIFAQWRAVLLSYDEGLCKGDAMLAAAVWRNLMGGKEDVDFQKLAQVVSYMRRELRALDQASDDEVAKGTWQFSSDPGVESDVVAKPAREQ